MTTGGVRVVNFQKRLYKPGKNYILFSFVMNTNGIFHFKTSFSKFQRPIFNAKSEQILVGCIKRFMMGMITCLGLILILTVLFLKDIFPLPEDVVGTNYSCYK